MRFILFSVFLFIILNTSYSQNGYVPDSTSLFFGQKNIQSSFDSTFNNLDTSFLPVKVFIDKTLWTFQPENYSGTITSDTLNVLKFYQIYSSIRNSQYQKPDKYVKVDSLKKIVLNYESRYSPIGMIFYNYSKIKHNAFDDTLLTINNGAIFDVLGRSASPYEMGILFAASQFKNYYENGNINFKDIPAGDVIIDKDADVRFISKAEVQLKSGFQAMNGSNFQAKIQYYVPCQSNINEFNYYKSNPKDILQDSQFQNNFNSNKLENEFNIFPNPAKDILNLTFVNNNIIEDKDLTIKIVNSFGITELESVMKFHFGINNYKIDIDHLQNGIYYVILKTTNSQLLQRLVILK